MKIATICSGIGAPEKALKNLGVKYELAYFCEIDKFAVKSYCAIHNEDKSKNIGDLTKVDISTLPCGLDLIVGGTPCQDFSLAGKRAGGEIDSGTRSSLMWNFIEIIRETHPKAVLWENVPGAVTQDNIANYNKFIKALIGMGYKVTQSMDNAKNFGIPQNRKRIYVMAGDHYYKPPVGYDCGIRLKDVLEPIVDEKYYLSEKMIAGFLKHNEHHKARGTCLWEPKTGEEIANTLRANAALCPTDNSIIEACNLNHYKNDQMNRVYTPNGIAPTIETISGGGREPKIAEPIIYDAYNKKILTDGICGTLTAHGNTSNTPCGTFFVTEQVDSTYSDEHGRGVWVHNGNHYWVRKLTPLEEMRLMGFSDADFEKCKAVGMSNSQLYKQAGNSMVVNHVMAVLGAYYGLEWKEKVYGVRYKTADELMAELPLFGGVI